jgi:MFS transporter, ACS family, hexuronate transporter
VNPAGSVPPASGRPGPSAALRWLAASVFFLTSAINYLDRQLLAACAPAIQREFGLSLEGYGLLLSVFSIVYAVSAPLTGLMIDRLGLGAGTSLFVGLWSLAGAATGVVRTQAGLLASRAVLGFAQAGGIPATGKASAMYLYARERALGAAMNQVGLSLGSVAAPLLAAWALQTHDWRWAFVAAGLAGLVWIPVGLMVVRRIPATQPDRPSAAPLTVSELVRQRAFWLLMGANILAMTVYTLWTNWTTIFFVVQSGLSAPEANRRFAWMPPLAGAAGGFLGGWAAHAMIGAGVGVLRARLRIAMGCAVALLVVTAAVPHLAGAGLAAAAISLSFMLSVAMSVNIYSMPLDMFGPERAAFSTAALTASYGVLQTLVSPGIGWLARTQGFGAVCLATALAPLMSVALLHWATRGVADRR